LGGTFHSDMIDTNNLSSFNDLSYYSAHFMDRAVWEPYVREVCQRHAKPCDRVSPGLPGTFPTFIVKTLSNIQEPASQPVVVKLFGPLFDGNDSFNIERDIGQWLETQSLPIPSPCILANGQLQPGWWYLIFDYVDGLSIGQVRDKFFKDDLLLVARQSGEYLHCLHKLTADPQLKLATAIRPSVNEYINFLQGQRDRCMINHCTWNDLPSHLLDELESFVLPVEQLIDFSAPVHLIHADFTADHLLGRLENGRWHTLAIIDWGDARAGNILYELVALHLDLFQGDKHLLQGCLEAYELPDFYRHDFSHKALSVVLLHQFPMPARVYEPHKSALTLQELAEGLFGV
jgi:hypothetical protein